MRALILDKGSWKKHIMLDKITGLDPPGVKLRAAQGFGESCSEPFLPGLYWSLDSKNQISRDKAILGPSITRI